MTTFVDTGAWFARIVPTDPQHRTVMDWFRANNSPVFTTDYVIDETLTLLRARGEQKRAVQFGRAIFDLSLYGLHMIDESDLKRAWEYFRDEPAREWSFTDCTSRAVIERLHLKRALTFDRHFSEFGSISIEP
jgi:uncharacterized protein